MARNKDEKPVWDRAQVRMFVKAAKETVGGNRAWRFVGPAVRRMVIRAECWNVFCMVAREGFSITEDQARRFEQMMCEEAGIVEEVY